MPAYLHLSKRLMNVILKISPKKSLDCWEKRDGRFRCLSIVSNT